MEFDYNKLKGRIREKLGTQEELARLMELSHASVSFKLNNKSEWTQREMNRAAEILEIPDDEYAAYFFTPMVQKTEQEGGLA